ncbi:hypothetical protein ACXR0O_24880 [Verrucomicrobiota bacterium sgz303538]
MGHNLHAIIGPRESALEFAARWQRAHTMPLAQGFLLIPVTEVLLDDIAELHGSTKPDPFAVFSHFSDGLAVSIADSATNGPLAYIETEYFGGVGEQYAILWENGHVALGPLTSETKWSGHELIQTPAGDSSICQVLRRMGVWKQGSQDEFDALGLGAFRETENISE